MSRKNKVINRSRNLMFSSCYLLFIGLKLGEVIQWSWWWMFAPLAIDLTSRALALGLVTTFYKTKVAGSDVSPGVREAAVEALEYQYTEMEQEKVTLKSEGQLKSKEQEDE